MSSGPVVVAPAAPARRRRWKKSVLVASLASLALLYLAYPYGMRQWRLREARAALQAGDIGRALSALKAAESVDSNHPEVQFLLGRAERRSERVVDAARHFERAKKLGWPENQVLPQLTLLRVQSGRVKEVEAELQQLLRQGVPDELAEEIYEAQAKGFLATYRLQDAIICLTYWLQWRPEVRRARLWRADAYERMGLWESALDDYQAVLAHSPDDVESRTRFSEILLRQNRLEEALQGFTRALEVAPGEPAARIGQAKALRQLGRRAESLRELQVLLGGSLSDSQRAEVLVEVGQQALFDGDAEQALQVLTEAVRIDPLNCDAYSPLAQACGRLNRGTQAQEFALRREQLAGLYTQLHKVTLKILEKPDNPDLRHEAGRLMMEAGLEKAGVAWLHSAILCDSGHQPSHRALAEYFHGSGDKANEAFHRRHLTGAGFKAP